MSKYAFTIQYADRSGFKAETVVYGDFVETDGILRVLDANGNIVAAFFEPIAFFVQPAGESK